MNSRRMSSTVYFSSAAWPDSRAAASSNEQGRSADIEIPGSGPARPLIFAAVRDIVLKIIQAGVVLFAHIADLQEDSLLLFESGRNCPSLS